MAKLSEAGITRSISPVTILACDFVTARSESIRDMENMGGRIPLDSLLRRIPVCMLTTGPMLKQVYGP